MVVFSGISGILGFGQAEDQKMIKDKLIDGKKLIRFRGKLVKMIKGASSKFDGYSVQLKLGRFCCIALGL